MSLDAGGRERVTLEQPDLKSSETPEMRGEGGIRALVKRELERTWPSYLSSGVLNFLLGLVAIFFAFTVWEAVKPGEQARIDDSVFLLADVFFATILGNLSANWTSTRYLVTQRDPFSEYVEFLRTLPITPTEAVAGRAVVMLISTVAMACVFFLPLYAFAGSELRESLELSTYLSFAAVWVAYGLFSGGIILYLELGLRGGGLRLWYFTGSAALLTGTVLFCNLVLDVHLVAGSLVLVERYGALLALISLAAGFSGFTLLGAATVRSVALGSVRR